MSAVRANGRKLLVLVGGGHANALALKRLASEPIAGLEVLLVSEGRYTPYSGMITSLIAGFYRPHDIFIDLELLARRAKARFLTGRVESIDPGRKKIFLVGHGELPYDILSIDCGATPASDLIPGALTFGHSVKPIPLFQRALETFINGVRESGRDSVRVVQIGAGAAGCECGAALSQRLIRSKVKVELEVVDSGPRVLPEGPLGASRIAHEVLEESGARFHLGREAVEVTANEVRLNDGTRLSSDFTFIALTPRPAPWIRALPLEHTPEGYLVVDDCLRTSDPDILAAGDVAQNPNRPTPRAGVYVVRQAPVLFANWKAMANGDALMPFKPQSSALALLIDGQGRAYGYRGSLVIPRSRLAWWWKDQIDRRFIAQFRGERVPRPKLIET